MKRFLIQTINDRVKHDFAFALLEAIEYQNWFYNETCFEASLSELEYMSYFDLTDVTPIGSLEFVGEYLKSFYFAPIPMNIPKQLQRPDFLKRSVGTCNEQNIPTPVFIKSATKYKAFTDIIEKPGRRIPVDTYFWFEIVDIQSEWRAFVWQKKLVGLQYYLGDFTLFPDVPLIKNMIQTYSNCPSAYTLDVGVNQALGTFIIETHPLVSCGLYGFNDSKILPQMLIAGFEWFKNHTSKPCLHQARQIET